MWNFLKRSNNDADEQSFTIPEDVDKAGVEACVHRDQKWTLEKIIYDAGENEYSIATGTIADKESGQPRRVCAIRWNGAYRPKPEKNPNQRLEETGTPSPGGQPEWFVLPEFLWRPAVDAVFTLQKKEILDWLLPGED
ncbi:MAG: hypothetical protein GXP04_12190 [Alphaproteobacteria bacterium]|nr:hypothetical protein [Alphaproteobacteria bacterium]